MILCHELSRIGTNNLFWIMGQHSHRILSTVENIIVVENKGPSENCGARTLVRLAQADWKSALRYSD